MSTIMTFVTRHPVAAYFALTFTTSWGGALLAIGGKVPGSYIMRRSM